MPHLLLHLAPTAIRGTTAPAQAEEPHEPHEPHAQPVPLFAVYDLIDIVGRKRYLLQPRKRGAFSRDVWARLTHVPFGRPQTALESLASLAPIRASAACTRTTDMLVMPVPALLLLLDYVMHDAQRHATISDDHKRHARYVKQTLETLQKGDRSMLQTLTEPAPEIDAPEADAPHTARHRQKRKKPDAAAAATDVILRFSTNRSIFGTVHPVHEHVFSVYSFIDIIGRQLHEASNCVHFARRFWEYTIMQEPYVKGESVMASIRCSSSFTRRIKTPALNVEGLRHLIKLMLHHRKNEKGMYKGKRINKTYVPVSRETVDPIGEILDAYIAGDRSMIEKIMSIQ
jgi:hypothetical protein